VRFLLGGLIVSVFAAIGESFKPKTFSGLFGAAPSVALASISLAFHQHDASYVATLARWMTVGALALIVYCAVCVVIVRRARLPVWLEAITAWLAWGAVAFTLFVLLRRSA
jgi:hypothetical protein